MPSNLEMISFNLMFEILKNQILIVGLNAISLKV